MMIELLERIDTRELRKTIGSKRIKAIDRLLENSTDTPEEKRIAEYVHAVYGYDLLHNRDVRRLVFGLISPQRLKKLAHEHAGKTFDKPHDNALALVGCSWRAGSSLVQDTAKELDIPREYLPVRAQSRPSVELVEPLEGLRNLHEYQDEVRSSIVAELRQKTPKMLVQMPTGAGKTRTVVQAIVEHIIGKCIFEKKKCVVWLAHTEELCEQAIETIVNVWEHIGSCSMQVLRLWGSYHPDSVELSGSFVVASLQKMHSIVLSRDEGYLDELGDKAEIVVVDEAHKVLAPTFRRAVGKICKKSGASLIGITATPGRGASESANIRLAGFFNKNLIRPNLGEDPVESLRKSGILSEVQTKIVSTGIRIGLSDIEREKVELGWDLPPTVIQRLSDNPSRNKAIVDVLQEEIKRGNPCLVFACSTSHARILSAVMVLSGYSSSFVDCFMRKGARRTVIDMFKNGEIDVVFNYGVLSTGFDAPRIRTVVITRPTTSVVLYSQMIGRGLRGPKMGGGEKCTLIDVRDNYVNFGTVDEVYRFFDEYWVKG